MEGKNQILGALAHLDSCVAQPLSILEVGIFFYFVLKNIHLLYLVIVIVLSSAYFKILNILNLIKII